jgi:HTH-type transcriptional regulator/antitoxin MqsA
MLVRDVRPHTVEYRGRKRVVSLSGWWPEGKEGEGIVEGRDMDAADKALRELKAEAEGLLTPVEVRQIRLRLRLSQRRASELLGGGPRAFQKYESGDVLVSRAMTQLLRLLDRDPKRLQELIGAEAA